MHTQAAAHPDWKAPAEEPGQLIWPEPPQILSDTRDNHQRLKSTVAMIQNIPLAELRKRQRELIGIADDALVIASGHQTELYHPGVWAKDALAGAAARVMGAQPWHLAVDLDQPKHLSVRWPGGAAPISDDPTLTTAAWSGLLKCPSAPYLERLQSQLTQMDWPFKPAAIEFLKTLKGLLPKSLTLSHAITEAMGELDRSLGLEHRSQLVSPLLSGEPYLALAHHLLARADHLAHQYNAALAAYRDAEGIQSTTRPMPDLEIRPDECEALFWLDDLAAGSRRRATVAKVDGQWTLAAGADQFVFSAAAEGWDAARRLAAFLASHGLRLSPRAVTLTLWFRLLIVDEFIHGIGGGRYDQVTDALIAEHFGIEPPRFCVTTATLWFPTAAGKKRVRVSDIVHEGHQLKHRLPGAEKLQIARQIADLPRRSPQRQELFAQMHARINAAATGSPILLDWENRLNAAKMNGAADQGVFDRELFYAIQPRSRLLEMIAQYQSRFAKSQ